MWSVKHLAAGFIAVTLLSFVSNSGNLICNTVTLSACRTQVLIGEIGLCITTMIVLVGTVLEAVSYFSSARK